MQREDTPTSMAQNEARSSKECGTFPFPLGQRELKAIQADGALLRGEGGKYSLPYVINSTIAANQKIMQ